MRIKWYTTGWRLRCVRAVHSLATEMLCERERDCLRITIARIQCFQIGIHETRVCERVSVCVCVYYLRIYVWYWVCIIIAFTRRGVCVCVGVNEVRGKYR